jgi:hypothetical protein
MPVRQAERIAAAHALCGATVGNEDMQASARAGPSRALVGGICFEAACPRVSGSSAMASAMAKVEACGVARGTRGNEPGAPTCRVWVPVRDSLLEERSGGNAELRADRRPRAAVAER